MSTFSKSFFRGPTPAFSDPGCAARTLAAAKVNPSDAAIHDCVTTLAKSERSAARRGCVFVSLRRKKGGIF